MHSLGSRIVSSLTASRSRTKLPLFRVMASRAERRPVLSLIACPFAGGQRNPGVSLGPEALFASGLSEEAELLGYSVSHPLPSRPSERGDLELFSRPEFDPDIANLRNPRYISTAMKALSEKIQLASRDSDLVVNLGGDHSIGLATVHATLKKHPDAVVIWVDAHADINTPETTMTGSFHGCPLSFLLGLTGTDLPEFGWVKSPLSASQLVYIGLRAVDEAELNIMKRLGIAAFTMKDVEKLGIEEVVKRALEKVDSNGSRKLHVSFDIDALDPCYAPSTGTAVSAGLTAREGQFIMSTVAQTGRLVAFDLVEINPSIGSLADVGKTVAAAKSLFHAALRPRC